MQCVSQCVAVCQNRPGNGGCLLLLPTTATRHHCNTLQHTATHCNTLQHDITATHCNTKGLFCKRARHTTFFFSFPPFLFFSFSLSLAFSFSRVTRQLIKPDPVATWSRVAVCVTVRDRAYSFCHMLHCVVVCCSLCCILCCKVW